MMKPLPENIDLKLISSKSYKKIFPFLAAAFFITEFVSVLYFLNPGWIILLTVLNGIVLLILWAFSITFKAMGRLSIDRQNIVIAQKLQQPVIVPIASLEDLKISRGATHHKDNGMFTADKHDNWISFTFEKKPYRLEFFITDEKENEQFEFMMQRLRSMYPDFVYTSI